MRYVWILLLAGFVGCGGGTSSTGGGQVPPPVVTPPSSDPLPAMSGEWQGGMNFTTATGNLSVSLSETSLGDLSGSALSTPPLCQFNLAVAGKVYSDGQFYLQTADNTTLSLAGKLASDQKSGSGNIALGDDTGCGPRTGGTFSFSKQ